MQILCRYLNDLLSFVDPPPKVMAFLGNFVELRIIRNNVSSTINYEFEHQPTFEVHWLGTPKGKQDSILHLKSVMEIVLSFKIAELVYSLFKSSSTMVV